MHYLIRRFFNNLKIVEIDNRNKCASYKWKITDEIIIKLYS